MRQVYENYTEEDRAVWQLLYNRQAGRILKSASKSYLQGLKWVDFRAENIPVFDEINDTLQKRANWQLAVVPGIVPDHTFFELMSHKHFPATTWLRKLSEIDYLEEPDMFHDVFAHVPLLTDAFFPKFLEAISHLGVHYCDNAWAIERLVRVYWFSVEFGLIKEEDQIKIYGAGILSSPGETDYALNRTDLHCPFDVEKIMNTSFLKDVFQEQYFVINSYDQLFSIVPQIKKLLASG